MTIFEFGALTDVMHEIFRIPSNLTYIDGFLDSSYLHNSMQKNDINSKENIISTSGVMP